MRRSRAERGFSVALGLFAVVLAMYLFLQSPFFHLETVYVHGTGMFSEAEIMAIAGLRRDQNLFDIDLGQVSRRLLAVPTVKSALVQRRLPAALVVTFTERTPIAATAANGTLFALDVEGRVLGEVTGPQSLVVITLAEPLGYVTPGSFLRNPALSAALAVAADLPEELSSRVWEINAKSLTELELVTRDGATVRIGAWRDIDKKMQVLSSLLRQAEGRGARIGFVDVSLPEKPVVR